MGLIIYGIEHIGDNKIRCALTEQEIESLGYDIDEIIANSEITQEFMHTVLELVEEQEHIQMEGISPMVKAELLQDHSMAITFGADKEVSLRDLVNTVSHMIRPAGSGRCIEGKRPRQRRGTHRPQQIRRIRQPLRERISAPTR